MPKAFFVDTSRCTACRGCQIACKEWHDLPATETKQRGSHQNPPDLNPFTYKVVRFSEHRIDGKIEWFFFPDQCRHCLDAPCKEVADSYVEGAVIQDKKTGAILYTDLCKKLKEDECAEIAEACPYNVPRHNTDTGMLVKCDMCIDRQQAGLVPVCVKTCPTGTMNFGERSEMVALAEKTLAKVKKEYPRAEVVDADEVNVIYLVMDKPELYYEYVTADNSGVGQPMSRKNFLAGMTKPAKRIFG
ncbi:formate dehydrogenase iron-sulfur subunit [Maridesulfovibrio ferrireducens]|uniref:Formate dehydrogenase iron-sulfur subunit n=1 Tax=Maridesulfovibrio ferrireducens TaxID=246191 RepID=A0A1G9BB52_9BACT|nr:4Fe-4S dicluster domain-containing protein [Maridesulfovibrio ferrireducens]SDK36717.1 formate dehydrogenase iron-sulfur subunit [Maridesulfovibrio ferrireducens]